MSSLKSILSTQNLTIGYGEKVIARALNLELNKNEITCLLGPNGVGKSTLLRTLSNLQKTLSGSIKIENKALGDFSREALAKKIGIVTTERIGTPNMTIRELVATGRYYATDWLGNLSKSDNQQVEQAITRCSINYLAESKLSTLSDGQRQKAMIARVLAQDAEIIFLDEPTVHLDVVNRIEVMKLLSEIKQDKCILISTHELPLSLQFADKLWLMNFNESMICDSIENIKHNNKLSQIYFHTDFNIDFESGRMILKN